MEVETAFKTVPARMTEQRLSTRLRSDLVHSYQGSGDSIILVVKDPLTGRFFRFGQIEAFILGRLGGEATAEQLQATVEEQFGAALPRETLDQFLAKLGRMGLLETAERKASQRSKRVRGTLLYLRFPGFDPDRLVTWLASRLTFCFTRSFVSVSALLILGGVWIAVTHWDDIGQDLQRLYNFSSFLVLYVTVLAVVAFHEFAHGVTCKHFGGSVREMGFMLLYFQPAFYCNVSDAWLFPKKSHRMWVSFAGAYFELIIWAAATIAWMITDPYTIINYLALIIMATSGIKSLFNLNPLIKLDGYYLLSDWLGMPNLRQRAIGYLRSLVRRILGMNCVAEQVGARERRIFIFYGLLAWSYSTWLLGFIAWSSFGFATENYQGWGFVIFTILLAQVFHYPLRRSLAWPLGKFDRMKRWGKRAIRAGVLAGVACALFLVRTDLRVSGPFYVLPLHNCDVRAEVEGIIQEIKVEEGQQVKKGDIIALLSDRDLRAELSRTQAQIEETGARLRLLRAGTRAEELELARTLLKKADERVDYARLNLEMDEKLAEQQLISQRELGLTREASAVRAKELQEARDRLKLLEAGSRPEEIEATAAELNRLNSHQAYVQQQLDLLTVHTPVDGIVTTHLVREKVGQAVKKGDLIAEVHEMRRLTIEINVPEKEIADIRVGQPIMLKARAYPLQKFEAKVTAISPAAIEPEPRAERMVRVRTEIENPGLLLKPEMSGRAKIYCGERRLIDIVGRRIVRFFKVEFWSWW
jgi:putative peptide zinc metalloprotease protein